MEAMIVVAKILSWTCFGALGIMFIGTGILGLSTLIDEVANRFREKN